jgi:hypothetical protein
LLGNYSANLAQRRPNRPSERTFARNNFCKGKANPRAAHQRTLL